MNIAAIAEGKLPATLWGWRASILVLCAGLATLLLTLASYMQFVPGQVDVVTHVERLGSPPQEPQAPGTPVQLPWGFDKTDLNAPVTEYFRLQLPAGSQAIMINGNLGWVDIYASDGRQLEERSTGPKLTFASRQWELPPDAAMSPSQLLIRVTAPRGYRGELGIVHHGPAERVRELAWRRTTANNITQLLMAGVVGAIFLCSLFYLILRKDQFWVFYLALGCLLNTGRYVLQAMVGVPELGTMAGLAYQVMTLLSLTAGLGFILRKQQPSLSRTEVLLWMWAALMLPAILLSGLQVYLVRSFAVFSSLAFCVAGLYAIWRQPHGLRDYVLLVLAVGMLLQLMALVEGLLRHGGALTINNLVAPLIIGPIIVMTWGGVIAYRIERLLRQYQALNTHLQDEVQAKSGELMRTFAQMQAQQREKDMSDERARLMQEMHDGLGARVTAALHIIRREHHSPVAAQALQDALTEMRLIMDALEPNDGDLATILGNLRYRLEPQLEAAGFKLRWQVEPLDVLLPLKASDVLHLQRIVEEALTNAVKHSGGDTITLDMRSTTGAGAMPVVRISITDNGPGTAPTGKSASGSGRGLPNMQRRAGQLGGKLSVSTLDTGGTCVALELPVTLNMANTPTGV
ncbi:MAG: hypothetical protein RLZZ271_157 [Pseudomonadota bacterium]|jgi:signal transduction histidine kinase